MDAQELVTLQGGDRYPIGPPILSVAQGVERELAHGKGPNAAR